MEEAQLEASKPSQVLMGFPRYRRSHLKSETFRTLVRILSHCCDESPLPGANQIHSASQEHKNHDNGTDRMELESQIKELERLQFTGTDFKDPKDPVSHKETQVLETFEGVIVHGKEFSGEFMMGVEGDEGSSERQDMMLCESVEALPMGANGLNKELKKIEELNQIVEGTERLVCDNGLTPLNLGCEKQNGSSEVELMDYQVGYVQFKGSDINTSGTESELYVEGEFNQHASEVFHASLIANISTSTKEQTSVPVISTSSIKHDRQQKEMDLVKPFCAEMVSPPTIEEGEFEKEEQHGQKVNEAMHLSGDQGMKNCEAMNLSIQHERQQKEMELVKPVCTEMVSLPTTEEGEFEKEEQHGQEFHEAMQFSVDQGMKNSEALSFSIQHKRQQKEIELVKPVCAAVASLPTNEEGEFEKEEQHGQKFPEAMHFSVDQSMNSEGSIKHERQEKEMELVKAVSAAMVSLPAIKEGEFEKEEQQGQKVPEAMQLSVDVGMNSEALNLSEYGEEMSLLDIDILEAKHAMQHEEEQPEKKNCANDATIFYNNPNEEGDVEEGEISGDFGIDDILFDLSSADPLMIEQRKDEVQKPKNVIENIVYPFNIQNGEKEENYESTSFMISTPQDSCNSGRVEPCASDRNGFPGGVDIGRSREIISYGDVVDHGAVLETGKNNDRDTGMKGAVDLPVSLAYNQVLDRSLLQEEATEDHQNTSAVKKAAISCKKKRGPITEEKKAKKKEKKRKKRAEKNRKLGVKRLKLHPVQKPKTITYCRHYLKGRCHEGEKCKFSHDIVPLTKSKPCCHFARHSCMKGNDCPFDHQLSKYPCSNFVTRGSCSRGDACMFSHQMPAKQDIPTSSNDSKAEMKPQLPLGNTKLSKPPNISGSSASQQKRISDSKGIQSHIDSEHEVADTVKKPPTQAPKGISFINVSTLSLPYQGTPKQGKVTPNKESVVKTGTLKDQTASGTALNLENPKKTPVVTPKGVNFLSFGKGRVSSFKSSISSLLNWESGSKLSQKENLGSPEQASSSLHKDDCNKVGSGTKQGVLQTALCSNELLKQNQSVAERMNLDVPGNASLDQYSNDENFGLTSHQDQSLSRLVQDRVKAYTSQTSTVTSSRHPASPFLPAQSSEHPASGHHKHMFNSAHRALISTLSFAAEHESNIKLKCSAGASALRLEMNKDVSNSSS